jgi:effector-binding domain-containing protein
MTAQIYPLSATWWTNERKNALFFSDDLPENTHMMVTSVESILDICSRNLLYSAPILLGWLVCTLSHINAGETMSYQVTIKEVEARPTAVVPATTTWQEFPTLWRKLSDEVWACLNANGIYRGCRAIMLYIDNVPHVEVGVELLMPCKLTGRVIASSLPAGQVAMITHWGHYSELGEAYRAVIDWCAEQGKQRTSTRWEVYGPHNDDPTKVWTELYWLLK